MLRHPFQSSVTEHVGLHLIIKHDELGIAPRCSVRPGLRDFWSSRPDEINEAVAIKIIQDCGQARRPDDEDLRAIIISNEFFTKFAYLALMAMLHFGIF